MCLAGLVLAVVGLAGCDRGTKEPPPAKEVAKPKPEGDLAFLVIPEKSCKSLKIKSDTARHQLVQEHAEFTGWITVPQGHEVTLTAPQAGYVHKAKSGGVGPMAGKTVEATQELFRLDPVLSPVEELQKEALKRDVATELAKAMISLKLAKTELERLKDLQKQELISAKAAELDKARERVDQAQETVNAAKDKEKLFVEKQPISIKAPLSGTVLTVHANPGEFVAKSAPLVTIADLSKLWVRVPIPEHEVAAIKENLSATISLKGVKGLGGKTLQAPGLLLKAKWVAKVPVVDPQKHTVDLIYELVPDAPEVAKKTSATVKDMPEGEHSSIAEKAKPMSLVKDQMVTVRVPLGPKQKETVVPYSAVVFDNIGGTWIYLDEGKKKSGDHEVHRFKLRRVELGLVVEGGIVIRVLQPPLDADDLVVTEGAAQLFSSEFHSAPGGPQEAVDDDD